MLLHRICSFFYFLYMLNSKNIFNRNLSNKKSPFADNSVAEPRSFSMEKIKNIILFETLIWPFGGGGGGGGGGASFIKTLNDGTFPLIMRIYPFYLSTRTV